ncbi:PAS domain-containing sensor histidine kinase [Nitrospira sp. Nam74]
MFPGQHEERLFRLLVDRVKDYAIFMIDSEGRVITWNLGAECVKGYTADQILGQSWRVFYPEEAKRNRTPERLLEKARSEGRAQEEGWRVRKDGSRFWADVVITAIRNDDHELIGFAKVTRDLTERRASELAVQKLNETLEDHVKQRTKELQALAAEVSRTEIRERRQLATALHDNLGQVLALANMNISMLQKNGSSTRLSQVKYLLDEALTYTRTLVSDLRPPLLGNADDLLAAIQWVVKKVERLGLRADIQDDGEPKPVTEEVLTVAYQSIQELLINALKHSQMTHATVSLRRTGGYLEAVVQDHGVGFDVLAARSPSNKGAFGLFNMRERLSLVGGDLKLTSIANQGTCAKVVLPLKTVASSMNEPQTISGVRVRIDDQYPRGGRAIRVLLADDHALMQEGLRHPGGR